MTDSPRRKTATVTPARPREARVESIAYQAFSTLYADPEHLRPQFAKGAVKAAAEAARECWTPELKEREWLARTVERLRQG
jgi:hypothetical protein